MRIALGLVLGASACYSMRRPVLCETLTYKTSPIAPSSSLSSRTVDRKGVSRWGGRLDYHQLALGSFTGMVTGWVIGKLSKVMVSLVVGSFLTLEYLQYSGSIDLTPWANSIYRWGLERINTEVIIKDPSFKVSFFSAFLIAAANS